MTVGVSIPFRIATSAVRRNANLRRDTSALRAAAKAANAARSLGARFPATMLGGELLAMMSAQFRDLLQHSNHGSEASYLRGARGKFGTIVQAETPTPQREWGEARPERRAVLGFPESAGVAGETRPSAAAAFTSDGQNSAAFNPAVIDRAAGNAFQFTQPQSSAGDDEAGRDWPSSATPSTTVPQPAPEGMMARQLREYWELERTHPSGRAASGPSRTPRVTAPSAPVAAQPAKADDSSRSEGQAALVRRLRAFVSGQGTEPAPGQSPWEAGVENSQEARSLRESSLASPAGAQALDFAEHLSVVLRQQAMQHGIDVT